MAITLNGTTGVVAPALSGDGSGITGLPAPSTSDVLTATAGASVGAVGTYATLSHVTGASGGIRAGASASGSLLRFSATRFGLDIDNTAYLRTTNTPSGTWRFMGDGGNSPDSHIMGTWLRIS